MPRTTVGEGLRVGHLHLHVGDIEAGLALYSGVVGFALQANLGSAAFLSAGGYHHHLAVNVWNGQGVQAPPPHSVGLRAWTVVLDAPALGTLRGRLERAGHPVEDASRGFLVRDPWGTALRVTTGDVFPKSRHT